MKGWLGEQEHLKVPLDQWDYMDRLWADGYKEGFKTGVLFCGVVVFVVLLGVWVGLK